MANIEKHAFKIWKGTRKAYDKIATKDDWTRYVVEEANGRIREFYGSDAIDNHIIGDTF